MLRPLSGVKLINFASNGKFIEGSLTYLSFVVGAMLFGKYCNVCEYWLISENWQDGFGDQEFDIIFLLDVFEGN